MNEQKLSQSDIRQLQQALSILAMIDSHYTVPAADGIYGPKTTEAVRIFQRLCQLPETGEADTETRRWLEEDYREMMALLSDPQPIYPFPAPYAVLTEGESGATVAILQAILREIGSDYRLPVPLITGVFDTETVHYIKQWQEVLGMNKTGHVNQALWDRLAAIYNARLFP